MSCRSANAGIAGVGDAVLISADGVPDAREGHRQGVPPRPAGASTLSRCAVAACDFGHAGARRYCLPRVFLTMRAGSTVMVSDSAGKKNIHPSYSSAVRPNPVTCCCSRTKAASSCDRGEQHRPRRSSSRTRCARMLGELDVTRRKERGPEPQDLQGRATRSGGAPDDLDADAPGRAEPACMPAGKTVLELDRAYEGLTTGTVVAGATASGCARRRFSPTRASRQRRVHARRRARSRHARRARWRSTALSSIAAHVDGYDKSEATLAAGATQLEIDATGTGLAPGAHLLVSGGGSAEAARISLVSEGDGKTLVSLARALEEAYPLGDTDHLRQRGARHARRERAEEVLGSGDPSHPGQRFLLRRSPLALRARPDGRDAGYARRWRSSSATSAGREVEHARYERRERPALRARHRRERARLRAVRRRRVRRAAARAGATTSARATASVTDAPATWRPAASSRCPRRCRSWSRLSTAPMPAAAPSASRPRTRGAPCSTACARWDAPSPSSTTPTLRSRSAASPRRAPTGSRRAPGAACC